MWEVPTIFLLAAFLIWLAPFILVAVSDKTTGGEKVVWLLGMVFISWFAWILYMFLAPHKPKEPQNMLQTIAADKSRSARR